MDFLKIVLEEKLHVSFIECHEHVHFYLYQLDNIHITRQMSMLVTKIQTTTIQHDGSYLKECQLLQSCMHINVVQYHFLQLNLSSSFLSTFVVLYSNIKDIFRPFIGFKEVRLVHKDAKRVSFTMNTSSWFMVATRV